MYVIENTMLTIFRYWLNRYKGTFCHRVTLEIVSVTIDKRGCGGKPDHVPGGQKQGDLGLGGGGWLGVEFEKAVFLKMGFEIFYYKYYLYQGGFEAEVAT